MADALEVWMQKLNKQSIKELIDFIRKCDEFFDLMNVTHTYDGQKDRKPALYPVKPNDLESKEKFKVCILILKTLSLLCNRTFLASLEDI